MKDSYIKTVLIGLDQFIGSFIPGAYADETISSRAFRENWAIEPIINFLARNPLHCEESYWSEVNNRQNFPRK